MLAVGAEGVYETWCLCQMHPVSYTRWMPKLWSETIESHRREVRDAILDTTAALAEENGLLEVTMSRIAEETGIGRATLYKYFADVEAILLAWHERQIRAHLKQLETARDAQNDPLARLRAVLETYASISRGSRGHGDTELSALMHRGGHVVKAERHLRGMVRDLVAAAVAAGYLRDDVAPEELATYCLHALTAAARLPTKTALGRLVDVTLAGMERS